MVEKKIRPQFIFRTPHFVYYGHFFGTYLCTILGTAHLRLKLKSNATSSFIIGLDDQDDVAV